MLSSLLKLALLSVIICVHGHAVVKDPPPRRTGPAHLAKCGHAVTTFLESDIAGPIENAVALADEDYNCNAYLCRGYQYEDNVYTVKAVKPGDVLYFHVDLIAGHRPGYANVSIVDTAKNKVIGEPLRSWAVWPDSLSGPPRNDIDYNITIPDSLPSTCETPGKCVIQWFWYATRNKQTYESCHDFYVES